MGDDRRIATKHLGANVTSAELESVLRTVEPAVRLVRERHLRSLLHYLRDHGATVPANPNLPLWVSRDDLRSAEMRSLTPTEADPSRLLLLVAPEDLLPGGRLPEEVLRSYWRLIFQAAVMDGVDGRLSETDCADRLARFGPAAEREIRYVLESDRLVDPQAGSIGCYRAFAAAYLDLHEFAPAEIEEFFPSLPRPSAVLAVLGDGLDIAHLLAQTRPDGAATPTPEPQPHDRWADPEPPPVFAPSAAIEATDPRGLLARATEAEGKGNLARGAILRTQALPEVTGKQASPTAGLSTIVGPFVEALGRILEWDDSTCAEWRQSLGPLLVRAGEGIWPRAARCLYELQKIPTDLAREVYAVDLVEVARTLGRRPIKRPLPHAREVMILVRLRAAQRQLLRSGLGEQAQLRLDHLFRHEIHRLEHRIRETLTPVIMSALMGGGFQAENRVEEVARAKVVAELLDRICERGYLRIADLRDAIARNQLKMPDLSGPGELISGDPLLRTDTRLAYELDGVYRRGEFYLRLLQRGSSLFFGTPLGRLLTLYLIGPFLAAFLTLMALEELRHIGGKVTTFVSKILAPRPAPQAPVPSSAVAVPEPDTESDEDFDDAIWFDTNQALALAKEAVTSSATTQATEEHHSSFLTEWPMIVGLWLFLFMVFHVPPFRRAVLAVVSAVWGWLWFLAWVMPVTLLQSSVIRSIRYSRAFRFVHYRLGGAIILTGCFVLILSALGASTDRRLRWSAVVFGFAAVVLNTPWGWVLQERLAERVGNVWRMIRGNMIPGLLAAVIDWFARLANWFERKLYAVDEWLRFRGGQSQGSLAMKAAVGLLWFPLAYIARFAFNLLIEPQINPIKHFPVVTVSHKVILPMTPSLAQALNVSDAAAAALLGGIPGIFGFIAWEFMANWKLYRSNRPERLTAVTIGSHGESMRGLLRPGFHSGTVPKVFRRMRATDRRGVRTNAARHNNELHHVAEGVEHFVARELVGLLKESWEWDAIRIEVESVHFGCQRVVIEMAVAALAREPFAIAFENRAGRVGATIECPGWLSRLTPPQREVFLATVRGLLDKAAAELLDDAERSPGVAAGKGGAYPELIRPYTWTEWVTLWGPPREKPMG